MYLLVYKSITDLVIYLLASKSLMRQCPIFSSARSNFASVKFHQGGLEYFCAAHIQQDVRARTD